MNDNHSPAMQTALRAVQDNSSYSQASLNRLKVAIRDTTASAGNEERPFSFLHCLSAGVICLILVWLVIGPAWVGAIDLAARLCQ